jgi:Copper binding proteins, plastocyanin/azurin family
MSRNRLMLALLGALVMLALPSTATTAPSVTALTGTTGPGFTITLKKGGTKVRTLKAGSYRITVNDRSSSHDFVLRGPVRRQISGLSFMGRKTITVRLRKGSYTYVCTPHASQGMRGSFRVT